MSFTPTDVTTQYGFGPGATNSQPYSSMAPVLVSGNWFYIAQDGNTGQTIKVFKSTDNQATWSVIATLTIWDGTHFPDIAGVAFDGAHTLVVYWFKNDGTTVMDLVAFDCNAVTFGSLITTPALSSGSGISVQSVFIRPTGTYCIFYGVAVNPPAGTGHFHFREYTPGGASWSSIVNVWTSVPVNAPSAGFPALQSTGVFHVLGEYLNNVSTNNTVYVQIGTGNALSGFHDFGNGSFTFQQQNVPVLDEVNGNIIWPLVKNNNFWALVGTGGLTTPSWGSPTQQDNTVTIDTYAPTLVLIGTELYGVVTSSSFNQLWLFKTPAAAITSTGAVWDVLQIFDSSNTTISGWTQNALFLPFIAGRTGGVMLYFQNSGPGGLSGDTFEYSLALSFSAPAAYHYRVLASASLSPGVQSDSDWTIGGVKV